MRDNEWNPGRLLELSGSYWQTCALHSGVKLEVFTILDDEVLDAKKVADRLDAKGRGVVMLLNALAAMGLLVKSDQGYANSFAARDVLCKGKPGYIGHMLMHHHHLMASWSQLNEAVIAGKPLRERASVSSEQWRESFLLGMFTLAMGIAPDLTKTIDLSGRQRLLDLGGGPGTYAIHFCIENPQLEATVFDLATTRPFAEKTITSFDLSQRVAFVEGDYITDPIEGTYDVIWLSHILHAEGPGDCQKIIYKAVKAAVPGALVIIHDFILNNTMDGPLFPALFSLNMLLGTEYGQSYSEQQVREFMEQASLRDTRRLSFRGPTDSSIMTGVVPGGR